MARYRNKKYSLFSRKTKSGTVWYYQYYIDNKRTAPVSSGIGFKKEKDRAKSKKEAEAYLDRLFDDGKIGKSKSSINLSAWITSKSFWDWDNSDYVKSKINRSDEDKPSITKSYVTTAAGITKNHILPHHGNIPLNQITPQDCENLLFTWAETAVHKTVNNRRSVYSSMMKEAERLGVIPRNPWKLVPELKAKKNHYGALSITEVLNILNPNNLDLSKLNTKLYYYATKLSFLTGLRNGEVCALYTDDVIDTTIVKDNKELRISYLHVTKTYNPKTKTRELVKDKDSRDIPITAKLRDNLQQFLTGYNRFLFSFHPKQLTPISANHLRSWLYKRLEDVGITDRKNRNVVFHSSRRFFNTLLRNKNVPINIIQKFTGHDDDETTEDYTDYLPQDLQVIAQAQADLLIE